MAIWTERQGIVYCVLSVVRKLNDMMHFKIRQKILLAFERRILVAALTFAISP